VNELLEERSPLVWLYTPMMLALAEAFCDAPLVYDKMDELAKFAHADPRIASREAFLLRRADIVFTGGRSLHRTVAGRTRDARCYPSGVDVEHFRRGRTMSAHPALDPHRGRPIFGYIGVIDERLDLGLIERLAAARPDAVVALVGPVAKIDERTLPRRENIAYLGKAGYDELPRLLAAFDVALMPFALNEHTENISPTKTLEYLAAGRPVVSTAVPDVVADHADVVHVAASTSDFIDAVSEALRHDRGRQARADAKIALATWDAIASAMERDLAAANILLRGVRNDRLGTGGA
jgi:glycosyltransferase involved in cell wall biosynthesis